MIKEELLIPLVGAVVVAVIAGAISLAVTILSKDQKTSEFRQLWIDAVREDVACLAGHWFAILDAAYDARERGEDGDDFMESKYQNFVDMEIRVARIILRLNSKEHKKMIDMLGEIRGETQSTKDAKEDAMKAILAEAQIILKGEWKRVKRGELSFVLLKWCSLAALAGGTWGVYTLYLA